MLSKLMERMPSVRMATFGGFLFPSHEPPEPQPVVLDVKPPTGGRIWQDHQRPAGTLPVRCMHCRCWFGLHQDRAFGTACRGGCSHCPGYTPGEEFEITQGVA